MDREQGKIELVNETDRYIYPIGYEARVRMKVVQIEDEYYPMGYRVVTEDLRSLGLRENPNILQYPIGEWFCLPSEDVVWGEDDWGGIWLARTEGKAWEYREYMREKHAKETRVFKAAMGQILYCNSSGRIKTDAICMFEEIYRE